MATNDSEQIEINPEFFKDGLPTFQFWFRFFDEMAQAHPELRNKIEKNKRRRYYAYIASGEWREKAEAFKKIAGYRCQLCNRSQDEIALHAHHRTYERLGFEEFMDVTILCADCHAKFHDK